MYSLMIEHGFSAKDIEKLLHISSSSMRHKLKKYNALFDYLSESFAYRLIIEDLALYKKINAIFRKTLAYPLFLFLISIVLLHIYLFFLFPKINSMSQMFDISSSNTDVMKYIVVGLILLFWIFVLMIIIVLFYYFKHPFKTYIGLFKFKKTNIWMILSSLNFSNILNCLLKYGYSTKKCFHIMQMVFEDKILNNITLKMQKQLLDGISIEAAFKQIPLDSQLIFMILTSIHIGNMTDILDEYNEMMQHKLLYYLKSLSKSLQYFSYFSISMILLMTYQILLIPMKYLQQL